MSAIDFESTETFEEPNDPVETPPEPTEDELREQEFGKGLKETSEFEDEPELPVKKEEPPAHAPVEPTKWFGEYSEDEVKSILEKARKVDELEAKIQKMHADTASQHGILKQQLKELKSHKPAVSKEAFNKLSEYVDDPGLVEALVEGLEAISLGSGPSNQLDLDIEDINTRLNEHIETRIAQATSDIETKLERKNFEERHADWQNIVESAEYAHWKSTLKPEALKVVNSTNDWREAGRALDGFKAWKTKKADAELKKQQRLESNLSVGKVPGRSQSAPNEDDFNAGVKSVVGGSK